SDLVHADAAGPVEVLHGEVYFVLQQVAHVQAARRARRVLPVNGDAHDAATELGPVAVGGVVVDPQAVSRSVERDRGRPRPVAHEVHRHGGAGQRAGDLVVPGRDIDHAAARAVAWRGGGERVDRVLEGTGGIDRSGRVGVVRRDH